LGWGLSGGAMEVPLSSKIHSTLNRKNESTLFFKRQINTYGVGLFAEAASAAVSSWSLSAEVFLIQVKNISQIQK